jgi:hypothetical protein
MTAIASFDLDQRASKLSAIERQKLSVHRIRLGQERPGWKQGAARRLNAMGCFPTGSNTAVAKFGLLIPSTFENVFSTGPQEMTDEPNPGRQRPVLNLFCAVPIFPLRLRSHFAAMTVRHHALH